MSRNGKSHPEVALNIPLKVLRITARARLRVLNRSVHSRVSNRANTVIPPKVAASPAYETQKQEQLVESCYYNTKSMWY